MADEKKTKYQVLEDAIAEIREKLDAMVGKPVEVENLDFDAMVKEAIKPFLNDILERLENVEKRFDSQLNKGIPVSKFVGEHDVKFIMRTGDDLVDEKGNVSPRPQPKVIHNEVINLP